MLTRLKVAGFKNLVDVEVRFGPFTCIAGINGVGKSNLLDAISFLSALTDRPLLDAAMRVREQEASKGDVASIFHCHGTTREDIMSFEADMVIPRSGTDDLGQKASATTTFVRYKLSLRLRDGDPLQPGLPIEIISESLTHIRAGDFKKTLGFRADNSWIKSALIGKRSAPYYISTDEEERTISVHQDGGTGGRTRKLSASTLPRTVLSSANAVENPTATLVREEMRSWRLLQLEPSALRRPDNFTAPTILGADGSHLPATLYNLANRGRNPKSKTDLNIYSSAANRLAELLNDVRALTVDRDEKRSLLTLLVAGRDGTFHPARALSDGTLRFLALAVIELDPQSQGVICMEEPENGIHPARIPSILSLLQDIAVDVKRPLSEDNPLRQVIINTHSPAVVAQVPESSLIVAEPVRVRTSDKESFDKVTFSAIKGTWRESAGAPSVPPGKLLEYLAPFRSERSHDLETSGVDLERRVIDSPLLQGHLFEDSENALHPSY